jgi:hypothetical protein
MMHHRPPLSGTLSEMALESASSDKSSDESLHLYNALDFVRRILTISEISIEIARICLVGSSATAELLTHFSFVCNYSNKQYVII